VAKKKTPRRIIEGDVSNEKLKQLVEQDSESRTCEYKPGSPLVKGSYQQARIVKSLVSSANQDGGWVVLGLADKTKSGERRHPIVGLNGDFFKTHQVAEFDEEIRDKVSSYLEDSDELEIKAEIYTWNVSGTKETKLAIIHINKSETPILFKKDGIINNGSCRFKQGQYYYRYGKKNVCAGTKKLSQVIKQKVNTGWTKKQEEFLGIKELFEQIKISTQKQDEILERLSDLVAYFKEIVEVGKPPGKPTRIPREEKKEKLEEVKEAQVSEKERVRFSKDILFSKDEDFEKKVFDLLGEQTPFSFQRFLLGFQRFFGDGIKTIDKLEEGQIYKLRDRDLSTVLDKLMDMGIILVHLKLQEQLEQLKGTFYEIFELPQSYQLPSVLRSDKDFFSPSWIWGEVLKRIYVIGSYAVLEKRYKIVPLLVKQVIEWDSYWEKRYWARYTSVMFAREKRYKGTRGLCKIFSDHALSNNYIFERFRSKEDKVVDLMCQFDFLQCLISIKKNKDLSDCYPSFGSFYSSRIRPIVLQLIDNKKIRQEIVDLSDRELAEYIFRLDELCGKEFFVQWDSLVDGEILDFIEKSYTPGQDDTISY